MNYVVPKRTNTYADVLEAVGMASLVEELTGAGVRICGAGDRFVLEGKEIPAAVEDWPKIEPGYPFIYLPKDGNPPAGWVLDYEQERKKAEAQRDFRLATDKKREKMLQALRAQGLEEPPAPVPEYQMALFLAMMRRGWSSDKQLYLWLCEDLKRAARWIKANLDPGAYSPEAPKVNNSQVFNPISGKGVHRPKPDSTAPGSISGEVVDPFAEWLKYRGAYRAMLPYRFDGDFKVLVIEPADIYLSALSKLRGELRGIVISRKRKLMLDIETPLRLTELLIQHSDVLGNPIPLRSRRPADVVRGLHQAYFQNMGTSAALMNYSFTALPSWFVINDREDANAYLKIIRSFVGRKEKDGETGCLQSLREDRSHDVPVLQQFRRWLANGELKDFLLFCYHFAVHVMDRMGRDEWVIKISAGILDTIMLRGYNMQGIIEKKGFQSIARAVREATIYALQAQKQKKFEREVRFGLAQKWKQKIKGGDKEFIAALAEFVQQYNWESENLDVKAPGDGWRRHKVSASDLDELIALIHQHGAELVGMLLLAYGFARLPKQEGSAQPQTEVQVEEQTEEPEEPEQEKEVI